MTETTSLPTEEMSMQKLMNELYHAFRFFNYELFNNLLPDCSLSIGTKRGVDGMYYAERFVPKDIEGAMEADDPKLDEIMLNPASFDRDELHILSVMVHEMVHQWEKEYGTPGKGGYHNRAWAESMKAIGLMPTSSGEPGGKETGRSISHCIIENGLFHEAAKNYIEKNNFSIDWILIEKPSKTKTPRKRTYRCECVQPVYANLSGRKIHCLECDSEMLEDDI